MGVYTHVYRFFLKMLMEQILSFKKCYVYIDIHVDVCFEIEKEGMNMHQSTKHIARKTRVDRQ